MNFFFIVVEVGIYMEAKITLTTERFCPRFVQMCGVQNGYFCRP